MQAKSIKGKSIPELKAALGQSITADFKPTPAIVFSSKSQDIKGICEVIDREDCAILLEETTEELEQKRVAIEQTIMVKDRYIAPPPVVMMITAYGDEENYNTVKRLGADGFLTKPVDFKLLKDKLINIK